MLSPAEVLNLTSGDIRPSYPPLRFTFSPTPLVSRASSESCAGSPNSSTSVALVALLMLLSGASATDPVMDQVLRRLIRSRKASVRSRTTGGRSLRAQREAEVVCGASVLAGLEMGEGEVEAHPGQVGVAGEHGAEPRDGSLPVTLVERDRAVQEVEVVEVPFVRLDALEQELGVVRRTLRERGPGGFDQGFGRGGRRVVAAVAAVTAPALVPAQSPRSERARGTGGRAEPRTCACAPSYCVWRKERGSYDQVEVGGGRLRDFSSLVGCRDALAALRRHHGACHVRERRLASSWPAYPMTPLV